MYTELIVRYLHFIGIFVMMSTIVGEHLLLKKEMTRQEIKRLSAIDGIYGLSAMVVIGAGLSLWFWVGKPSVFYTKNWIFHTKMTLVITAALLSIYPTVYFLRNWKGDPTEIVQIPNAIKWVVRIELLLLFLAPLCAVFMARGIGFFG
ncbi:MAG: DUF2214 family protein [Aureispira sp.]|nr:DUF2214 family protein [Aureispira sp.]